MKTDRYWFITALSMVLVVFAVTFSHAGAVRDGEFGIRFDQNGDMTYSAGDNDGFTTPENEGPWFAYDNPGDDYLPNPTFEFTQAEAPTFAVEELVVPSMWWNEWWYNDPFVEPGSKWVQIQFDYELMNETMDGELYVTINWSTDNWVGEDGPPVPGQGYDPEEFLTRLEPWHITIPEGSGQETFDSGVFYLPIDYNPEWVSVDVNGENIVILNGTVHHQCVVPIPAAFLLLGSGLAGLAGLRRKAR